jgi:hypothetical protein
VTDAVVIERRFRGPPTSANGGYTCGVLAEAVASDVVEVNLRLPPPLDRPLSLESDGAKARLLDGEQVVADANALEHLDVDVPEPPPLGEAEEAGRLYPYFEEHTFPECFVCGPDRSEGDGLRIYPGPLNGRTVMACTWTPADEFADAEGHATTPIVWAALDCPSGLAAAHFEGGDGPLAVLARLRGRLLAPIDVARPHVVVSWPLGREGRKHSAATAIFDAGELRALADALWIAPRSDAG